MVSFGEKAKIKKAGNLNSGRSYVFTAVFLYFRNMNQTMSTTRRVAMYVTPVVMLSIVLNIPKFLETQIQETENGTGVFSPDFFMIKKPTFLSSDLLIRWFHES